MRFRNYRDQYGSETFIRPFSENVWIVTLREGSLVTLPVPAGMNICIINGSDYWVSPVANFTLPTAAGVSANTAEFEGAGYILNGVDGYTPITNLYFKASINTDVSVAFYR